VKPYLRFVEMPTESMSVPQMRFRGGSLVSLDMQVEDGVMKLGKGVEKYHIKTMA
jgi:hypothetical protein